MSIGQFKLVEDAMNTTKVISCNSEAVLTVERQVTKIEFSLQNVVHVNFL